MVAEQHQAIARFHNELRPDIMKRLAVAHLHGHGHLGQLEGMGRDQVAAGFQLGVMFVGVRHEERSYVDMFLRYLRE